MLAKLEQYKKTPRKRPDWANMMKEIEVGKTLRRVETNDRSRPILPKSKAKGKVLAGQTTFMPTDDTTIDGDPLKEVVIPRSSNHFPIFHFRFAIQIGSVNPKSFFFVI